MYTKIDIFFGPGHVLEVRLFKWILIKVDLQYYLQFLEPFNIQSLESTL